MNRRQFSAALALGLGAPARRYLSAVTPDTDQISEAPNTEKVRIQVAPTSVPEWDHEDEASSVLGGPELHKASDDEAQRMLDQMTLELPAALDWVELVHYAQQHRIVGGLQIPPDSAHCSFYVFEAPLSIILTGGQRHVRLRLNLDLRAQNPERGEVVAYDVFPPSDVDVKELASGELNLDISKALQFVLTASGAAAATPALQCLGFKLNLPFRWNTLAVKLQSSGRMSSRVAWYVTDASIQKGFAPAAILRAPRGTQVIVDATLAGELRAAGLAGWILKTQFAPLRSHRYFLG